MVLDSNIFNFEWSNRLLCSQDNEDFICVYTNATCICTFIKDMYIGQNKMKWIKIVCKLKVR